VSPAADPRVPSRTGAAASEAEPHTSWRAPPETLTLTLGRRDVHVWRASLDPAPMSVHELAQTLSEEERTRARRFLFERDRRRFIVCRGVLRALLGRYLRSAPASLQFRYGAHGKPALAGGAGETALRFNVAHADGTALYGVTLGCEIGIDLERVRSEVASDQIAEQFFSRREVAELRAQRPANRPEAFYTCWTRKEAYLKARGEGLSFPLSRFSVSIGPGRPAALVSTPDDPAEASRWLLADVYPGPGYVGAVAVEGRDWRFRCWQWRA
jgi:4'-phosphopantetheinyl transferase